jgi:hypothetical protein
MSEEHMPLAFQEEEDFEQARENVRIIMEQIEEIKPPEINLNPINNEVTLGNTTIKWKLKPKVFKILARMVMGGDAMKAVMETPFTFRIGYSLDEFTEVWGEVKGRLSHFEDFYGDDRDFRANIGATFRF